MLDLHSRLRQLNRPKLLVRAARFGLDGYRRDATLARLLPGHTPARPAATLIKLLEVEAACDAERTTGAAAYQAMRHIDVLTAIMVEARLMADTQGPRSVA